MKESDLKRVVEDFLTYGRNQGKWYYDRLNSGSAFVGTPQHPRRIQLCREGTADFYVLKLKIGTFKKYPQIIFLELKSEKGRQRPEQKEFMNLVWEQGAEYHIIRSIEEVEAVLG